MSFTPSDDAPSAAAPPPRWACVFDDPATAIHFVAVVADVIDRRWGDDAVFDQTVGSVRLPAGSVIHFANTARELAPFDEPYWRSYLYLMFSANESFDPEALQTELRSWTRIRSRLRIRLHPAGPLALDAFSEPLPLVERRISETVSFVIAADTDLGSVAITTEVADAWEKPLDQAWRAAIKNTRSRSKPRGSLVQTPTTSFMLLEGDLFTTGHARDLRPFRPDDPTVGSIVGRNGALLMAPTSRTLFVKPIDDTSKLAIDSIGLISAAGQFQAFEPNPLSLDVFWYRGVDDLVGVIEVSADLEVRKIAPPPFSQWLDAA